MIPLGVTGPRLQQEMSGPMIQMLLKIRFCLYPSLHVAPAAVAAVLLVIVAVLRRPCPIHQLKECQVSTMEAMVLALIAVDVDIGLLVVLICTNKLYTLEEDPNINVI